ncbi:MULTISPECIES: TIGR03862 family flavoprotein [Bosea]|uniref:NAD(P)/FAD-dependent oxidoreductase n=1 Tax=Bosea TaxID=85413 RepID=UPI002150584E|nr:MULTISPECIES: TIGR03862 family flavoprotein [Bosea]MCR4523827.1 TIGR03862 family flavoprotein [Bosea sp. 47.2.35]MDR6830355.1 putative flavoprotein (TIGR03862 family) [Bosea robiniae]MDR6897110.1 putative flavoprotein (TIGR03862 family) [Bosea sp. BE109]MDR7140507.1 putative flavoprotein (TIGR03862 family) [Bosea sp. BE168]MDR7177172.1 putative flavoprotein (TIGR03862 family) [Bosea sp. BE271]
MSVKNIAIIGAGPAGLIAAERLAAAGHRVAIYERMASPARKFLLAGRGGLNLTHSEGFDVFLRRYREAGDWLESALRAFPPQALRDWADGLGAETFIGSSGRVFPRAMKASPLLRAWLARLDGLAVRLASGRLWTGWSADGALTFRLASGEIETVRPDTTLLALGGASWPRLGSDGGWVPLLTARGVAMSPLRPANGGFTVAWSPQMKERFAGQPLKRIVIRSGGATAAGEAMIDAGGIEGGAIYALSAPIRKAIEQEGGATIQIDLRPDLTEEELAARLAKRRKGETLSNHLRKAAGLAPVAIALLRDAAGTALPDEPVALAASIKAAKLRLEAPMPIARAISTAGGIVRDECDAGFMLKRLPGVFVAGEMLDWEAPTGGYLLQASFATGVAAAAGMETWLAGQR